MLNQQHKLTVIQIFASSGWGGGERYVMDLSKALIDDGNEVVMISKKCPIIRRKIGPGQTHYQLPMRGIIDLYSPFKLAAIVKRHKAQIIHVHNLKDAFVAAYTKHICKSNIKIVLSRHLVKRSKTSSVYRWLYRQLDVMIFVSELAKNIFLSSKPKIDTQKIVVIHNSINCNTHNTTQNIDIREKFGILPSTPILAFSGRVIPEKGVEALLDAMKIITERDFKLLILGTGNHIYCNILKQYIARRKLSKKVIMMGFVDDVAQVISQVDIGIIPSKSPEPFGLSIIEFMALGKPVITTNNGAQPEFIKDGINGFMVPPSDSQAIAKTVVKLLDDVQLQENIGTRAKQDFEDNLSYAAFYKKIKGHYINLINK